MQRYSTCERCGRHIRYSYSDQTFVLLDSEYGHMFQTYMSDCFGEQHRPDFRYLVDIEIPHRNRIP